MEQKDSVGSVIKPEALQVADSINAVVPVLA
jgi:hypothetical protein